MLSRVLARSGVPLIARAPESNESQAGALSSEWVIAPLPPSALGRISRVIAVPTIQLRGLSGQPGWKKGAEARSTVILKLSESESPSASVAV